MASKTTTKPREKLGPLFFAANPCFPMAMAQTKLYQDKWALITGASAGIGKEFAEQLSEMGANLVLTARRKDRLEALQQNLQQKGIKVEIISADLADPKAPEEILAFLADKNITPDILINNAGFGLPGGYSKTTWEDQESFIQLMVTAYAHLAHALYKQMMTRGYGRIINVASVAGLMPGGPGHTLYGPSKAFLISFSESLNAEGQDRNVHCCALCPGFTWSEFHDVNGTRESLNKLPKFMMMEAAPVVAGGLKSMERGKAVYVPGLVYKTITAISGFLPRGLQQKLANAQMKKARQV